MVQMRGREKRDFNEGEKRIGGKKRDIFIKYMFGSKEKRERRGDIFIK